MNNSWANKPVVFFGRRIYILFAAFMSLPVWLAADAFMTGMHVPEKEASATAVSICFIAGIFTGRHLAELWALHVRPRPQRLVAQLMAFILVCLCWLFFHKDLPIRGWKAINMLLYWLPFLAMSLALGMLVKAVRALSEKQLTEARSSAAHSESELRLLQSQLSPHFLFNTLNNMYCLSITEHEKVPALLLRLSELLRHSVYGSAQLVVPLREEIDYIRNYIEFERMRLGDRLQLSLDIDVPPGEGSGIAPMLLIVFVENAFKHARNSPEEQIFISIDIRTWNEFILFSVKNSCSREEQRFNRHSGFGLDNVRKRLDLLYPGAYHLDIDAQERRYSVMLQVRSKTMNDSL